MAEAAGQRGAEITGGSMKKILKKLLAVAMTLALVFAFVACNDTPDDNIPTTGGMPELKYPDLPETPSDKNSWEYIPEDTEYTIDWYVDVSSWAIPAENHVIQKIKEDTGISVRFSTPVSDDGQKLATLIAGGLPDVVSVPTSNAKTQAMLAGEHLKGTVLIKAIQVDFRNSKNHS